MSTPWARPSSTSRQWRCTSPRRTITGSDCSTGSALESARPWALRRTRARTAMRSSTSLPSAQISSISSLRVTTTSARRSWRSSEA